MNNAMVSAEIHHAIATLESEHVYLVDSDRLEEWIELFTEDGVYKVIPRENLDQGLPVSLLFCEGRDMLIDRIAYLRKAATYNIHHDRHLLGPLRIVETGPDSYEATVNFTVFQSEPEGGARLFAVGYYLDRIRRTPAGWRFAEKTVVLESNVVMTLLSTPL